MEVETDRSFMKKRFWIPCENGVQVEMEKLGYQYHCGKDGRPCYHRQLNDPKFPRFHAYVTQFQNGIEIDLHFDALDPITHKGNHDQRWAYEGGRVFEEMGRIANQLSGETSRIAGAERHTKKSWSRRVPKNLIDLLFG